VIKSRRGLTVAAGGLLVALLGVLAILSWIAGGPQSVDEIVQPLAVPELAQ